MNYFLVAAALLNAVLAVLHSYLGERFLLGPLFRDGTLTPLFGSTGFARRTMRFAWHLTTLVMWGLSLALLLVAREAMNPVTQGIARGEALVFLACALLSYVVTRRKHFSWMVFLVIAALCWWGSM